MGGGLAMRTQDYLLIAAVVALCITGIWNIVVFNRRQKASKPKPKRNWLKELRLEAVGRLEFEGCWSGHWITSIMGVRYRSESVSGFKYVTGDCGTFVQDAIIDRCRLLRNKESDRDARQLSNYGRERYIDSKGNVSLW